MPPPTLENTTLRSRKGGGGGGASGGCKQLVADGALAPPGPRRVKHNHCVQHNCVLQYPRRSGEGAHGAPQVPPRQGRNACMHKLVANDHEAKTRRGNQLKLEPKRNMTHYNTDAITL